jgi:hypothetical protein
MLQPSYGNNDFINLQLPCPCTIQRKSSINKNVLHEYSQILNKANPFYILKYSIYFLNWVLSLLR